jgi:hypothetical protein
MKTAKHLGQSFSLVALMALASVGVIGLMVMQSGAMQ